MIVSMAMYLREGQPATAVTKFNIDTVLHLKLTKNYLLANSYCTRDVACASEGSEILYSMMMPHDLTEYPKRLRV